MSTYAEEREFDSGNRLMQLWQRGVDSVLAAELHTSAEFWLYTALLVAAMVLRFTDLGARALHHDESLHAYFSWNLAMGKGYVHDPLMHGPFLFHITAFIYLLFGASDASARFSAAAFGSALVLLPLLLRPWLGRIGALAAAVFLAVSPVLLYYSRFIRDDPYVVFFTLGLIICIFRYRLSRHEGWLFTAALILSLSFCSMEITFIIAAILLLYLDGALASAFAQRIADNRGLSALQRAAVFVALVPVAWLIAVAWPALERTRARWHLDEMPADGALLLVLGLLAAPQFAAAVRVPLKFIGYDINGTSGYTLLGNLVSRSQVIGALTVVVLLMVTFVIGFWWNQRRWIICLLVFYVPYFLLYTTFFTNRNGWGSGIWGSLGYWLDQQDVRRGTQPVFYYAMVLPVYEYLTLSLAALGLVIHAVRRGFDAAALLVFSVLLLLASVLVNNNLGNRASVPFFVAAILCGTGAMHGDRLRQFTVFYFGALFLGLSVAGEKMPWLSVHLALPLTLLAGLAVNDVFGVLAKLRGRALGESIMAIVVAGAAGAVAGAVLGSTTASDGVRITVVLFAALIGGAAAVTAGRMLRSGEGRASSAAGEVPDAVSSSGNGVWLPRRSAYAVATAMVLVAAAIGLLGLLTARADYRLNWVHPDTPDEMLIYTQSSPDVPKVAKQIDQLAMETGQGHDLKISVDGYDSFTWPWAWYLRSYHNVDLTDLSVYAGSPNAASALNPGSVLLVHASDQNILSQFAGRYGSGERYHLRWWFPEDGYRTITAVSFLSRVRNGSEFKNWWGYITNREGFGVPSSDVSQRSGPTPAQPTTLLAGQVVGGKQYLGSVDAVAYFPAGWVPGKGLVGGTPTQSAAHVNGSTLTIAGSGAADGAFRRPAAIAADGAGNIFVADSLNNRVEEFDANGGLIAQATAQESGTPFHEPWGIAVDKQGFAYVADTWNHRIVKLDQSLHVVMAWGRPSPPTGPTGPLDLYGPRAIAVDGPGNIWVTDTGNARVLEFDPNGKVLGVFGSRGSAPGQFQEPVGIAIGSDGKIYVADSWNNRVQRFSAAFAFEAEFKADSWVTGQSGRDIENKPFLAVLPDNTLLATFPNGDALVQYDAQGNVLHSLNALAGMDSPLRRPVGVAVGPSGDVLVSDSLLNQVVRVPQSLLR